MKREKVIWFLITEKGDVPLYKRKAYRKARFKRASERMAPGYWKACVKKGEKR